MSGSCPRRRIQQEAEEGVNPGCTHRCGAANNNFNHGLTLMNTDWEETAETPRNAEKRREDTNFTNLHEFQDKAKSLKSRSWKDCKFEISKEGYPPFAGNFVEIGRRN
jgi:hypothetical protein